MASAEPRGPRQILRAARYSAQGLKAAWRFESSFRLEIYMLIVLMPLAFCLGRSALERAILAAVLILVPTMELMNGALEAIVDKTTPEHHELAGRAKDMGSAAVTGCMMIVLLVWGAVALERFVFLT
jgi:diacylglycerol kinase (ATP)